MEWITQNWLVIAAIVYAAASEIIGMSPLKNNSVVEIVLSIAGKLLGVKPKE